MSMVRRNSEGLMGTPDDEEEGNRWITLCFSIGTKVVLPTEARFSTITTLVVEDAEENQRQLARNLDLLEEVRECTDKESSLQA